MENDFLHLSIEVFAVIVVVFVFDQTQNIPYVRNSIIIESSRPGCSILLEV